MGIKKELRWLGNSKKLLLEFPISVRKVCGYALHFAQEGALHPTAKPFKGMGSGVFEIVKNFDTDTYRVIYAISSDRTTVYVIHAFKKKSTSGIKTPLKEIELIGSRLKIMKELEDEK
jgi:phage-related protein